MGLDAYIYSSNQSLFKERELSEEEKKLVDLGIQLSCPRLKKKVSLDKCLICNARDRCWGIPKDFAEIHFIRAKRQLEISKANLRASSVATCVVKQLFQIKEGVVENPQNLAPIIRGEIIHNGLANLFNPEGGRFEYPAEMVVDGVKVIGHVDIYHPAGGEVMEVKVTRHTPKKSELKPYWLTQLAIYMYLLEAKKGRLIIVSRNLDSFAVYRAIPVDNFEEKALEVISRAVEGYKEIREGKEPDPDSVGPTAKELCAKCPFRSKCGIKFKIRIVPDLLEVERV